MAESKATYKNHLRYFRQRVICERLSSEGPNTESECFNNVKYIAEGFGRGGSKEFLQFLSIAKGSAAEIKSHLFVALDQRYLSKNEFEELSKLAEETARIAGGLMNYLKKSELRGQKYK